MKFCEWTGIHKGFTCMRTPHDSPQTHTYIRMWPEMEETSPYMAILTFKKFPPFWDTPFILSLAMRDYFEPGPRRQLHRAEQYLWPVTSYIPYIQCIYNTCIQEVKWPPQLQKAKVQYSIIWLPVVSGFTHNDKFMTYWIRTAEVLRYICVCPEGKQCHPIADMQEEPPHSMCVRMYKICTCKTSLSMGHEYGMRECPLQTAAECHVLLIRVFSVFSTLNNVGDFLVMLMRNIQPTLYVADPAPDPALPYIASGTTIDCLLLIRQEN